MKEIDPLPRVRAKAAAVGFLCASLASLAAGSMLAVEQHGVLRALFGGGGFAAYVYLFARALGKIGFPSSGVS